MSLMSEEEHHPWWPDVSLEIAEVWLCTYTGKCLKVLGQRKVAVCYGQQTAQLPLVVVAGKGPSFLSRDWLKHLRLDCQSTTLQLNQQTNVIKPEFGYFARLRSLCGSNGGT